MLTNNYASRPVASQPSKQSLRQTILLAFAFSESLQAYSGLVYLRKFIFCYIFFVRVLGVGIARPSLVFV